MEQRSRDEVEKNRRNGLFYTAIGWATLVAVYLLLKGHIL